MVQRNVVIEEFKQRFLNQPYGDVYPLIKDLAYKVHPYRWPTIGKDIAHIERATLDDVKKFFYKHYAPNNAVLTVSGNIDSEKIFLLAEKWFGAIPHRDVPNRNIPVEPQQTRYRQKHVVRDVPFDGIYLSFHMDEKLSPGYYTADLISDILSNGQSSRMYRELVIDKGLFSELDAYISGDNDPGLFHVSGKLIDGVSFEQAENAIWEQLQQLIQMSINETELQKVINKVEANLVFSEINYLNKAMSLALYELLGDASLINRQQEFYRKVTATKIQEMAAKLFRKENCSVLYYNKQNG
jgi:predicted Zn-dependent peptidase